MPSTRASSRCCATSRTKSDSASGACACARSTARPKRGSLASERRLRETFEQAAVGITRVDLDGRIVDVNEKFCQLLGYAKDELLGRSVQRVEPIRATTIAARACGTQVAGGAGGSLVGRKTLPAQGRHRSVWTRRTMSVGCDDAGRARHIISIVEDISESRELERRFELIFEHAAVGIALLDLEARYLQANEAAAAMLGYASGELIGISLLDVMHAADAKQSRAEIGALLNGDVESVSSEAGYTRKDGRLIRVRRALSLTRDAQAKPLVFRGDPRGHHRNHRGRRKIPRDLRSCAGRHHAQRRGHRSGPESEPEAVRDAGLFGSGAAEARRSTTSSIAKTATSTGRSTGSRCSTASSTPIPRNGA